MPTPREIADKVLFEEPLKTFRAEIDAAAAEGKTSCQRAVYSQKCIKKDDIDKSKFLKQAVEDFAKDGITLTFERNDHESHFFIKEDHWFVATW